VQGDEDGDLTAAVIRELSASGGFAYCNSGGDLLLKIKISDSRDENIGFRYDRDKEGRLTRSVIPTETRQTVVAEVSVIDARSCCCLLGPALITASVDYDHDFYSSRDGVNVFSLGQLSDVDEARDAVKRPVNRLLARRIVNFVSESW